MCCASLNLEPACLVLEATSGTVPAQRVGALSGRRTGWEVVQRGVGGKVKVVGGL